jgi:UDP-N-acetylglucosamine 4-epimerase
VYGDSPTLPKTEDEIGQPLSPYAITKLAGEIYAQVFTRAYGLETIGLRYFNVFGRRQDPNGPYAAVIPKWVSQMILHQSPVINGDGSYSRDFTYVDNVVHANEQAALAGWPLKNHVGRMEETNEKPVTGIFNIAYGGNATLNELFVLLRDNLSKFDSAIAMLQPVYGPFRSGDIPHSMASVEKARNILGYNPQFDARQGFEIACEWYWENLKG